jgi:SAM-dependent methyltransferase
VTGSVPTLHFDALYAAKPDPWNFVGDSYEQGKYDATMEALGDRRFAAAFEVGCSIGVLTRRLAARCDVVVAVDVAAAALAQARTRCADQKQVRIAGMRVPADWPSGRFDLILLSEVLYFLDLNDLRATAGQVLGSLAPEGLVLLVNWRGDTAAPFTGEAAADLFLQSCGDRLSPLLQRREPAYRLDLLSRR